MKHSEEKVYVDAKLNTLLKRGVKNDIVRVALFT